MIDVLLKLLNWAAAHVRENPPGSNAGEYVESIQRFAGGRKGDAWCAEFVYFVGQLAALASGGYWPLPRTGSAEALHQYGLQRGLLVPAPRAGDVYVLIAANGRAEHTGFVTAFHVTTFDEISGNTSDPSRPPTRDGWGVFGHRRTMEPQYRFIRWSDVPSPLP